MYKLHGFCQSGNTFKVAFMLRALKQPYEDVFVDFMHGATRSNDWRAQTNAMGEAPVLEVDGRLMTQSGSILTYLARKHGAFGGLDEPERDEVLRWLLFDNHKFTSYLASYRFNKSFGPAAPDPAVMAWLLGRVEGAWGVLEKHLAVRDYVVGSAPTIADFSLCGYLFYPVEESGIDIEKRYPNMHAWLQRLRKIEGWALPYDILPGERIAPRW